MWTSRSRTSSSSPTSDESLCENACARSSASTHQPSARASSARPAAFGCRADGDHDAGATLRIEQKVGTRGSLMYLQRLVSRRPELLDRQLREAGAIPHGAAVRWVSPREDDNWAEYR